MNGSPKSKVALPQGDGRGRLRVHVAIAVVALALAWGLVAFVIFPDDGLPQEVVVPPVAGLPLAEAQARLKAAGLGSSLGERRASTSAPRNIVLSQNPVPGVAAQRGVRVTLDVSAGQRPVTIPRLAGLGREDAERALRRAGLEAGQTVERPGAEARGTVIESEPRAGQSVPEGSAINLVVSSGPAELTMPDVVGQSTNQARAMLEQLGLLVDATEKDSASTLPAGVVISQIPAAGSPVTPGATVSLRISARP